MSIGQKLVAKIRLLVGVDKLTKDGILVPSPERIDPEKALDAIAQKVVTQHGIIAALTDKSFICDAYANFLGGLGLDLGTGGTGDMVVPTAEEFEALAIALKAEAAQELREKMAKAKEAVPTAKVLTLH